MTTLNREGKLLRWNIIERICKGEYATDANGKTLFLITKDCPSLGGWVLYERDGDGWLEAWSFDTQEQARQEAEIRHNSSCTTPT